MTRTGLALALWTLGTAAAGAAPCSPSPAALCLSGGRFEVKATWKDFQGKTGQGQAVAITADTGYFWFFNDTNIELIVKVLDARALNGKFWVFFGALSNVEYDLTVTDSSTGASKTYHNPSGQFASVGDTGAFEAAARTARVSHEVVVTDGTAAPPDSIAALQKFIERARLGPATTASGPCRGVASALGLASCRFALQVSWRDSAGNTGRGTPVQLTNDTGYFWFFSPSNVELVVKVLDARPVNGDFWVFYGALSNVAYTLTVTDSLSGVVRIYTNPAGAFASVGDTTAFHAGRSVTPVPDAGRAVFADIDSAGGSISATAADGTHFVLELPPHALGAQTTVRMTPLARVDGLPLSRGFVGGVRLEPEGLRLFLPATLRMSPPGALRPGAVAFSYSGSGEEFALDISQASSKEMKLQLLHFSGYGAGIPGPGDVGNQQSYPPQDPLAALRQQILQIFERGRVLQDEDGHDIPPELSPGEMQVLVTDLVLEFYDKFLIPALKAGVPECNKEKMRWLGWLTSEMLHQFAFFANQDDPVVASKEQEARQALTDLLSGCLEKAHRDCVDFKDPFRAWDIILISHALASRGIDVNLGPGGPLETCLRFEFQFDSAITLTRPGISESRKVHASVPLRLDLSQSIHDLAWSGSAEIRPTYVAVDWQGCTMTGYEPEDGSCEVGNEIPALVMPLAFAGDISSDPEQFLNFPIRVGYDPGRPSDSARGTCSGVPTEFYGLSSQWRLQFERLHSTEHLGGLKAFLAKDWELLNLGGLFASKTYQTRLTEGVNTYTEDTEILIMHKPAETEKP